MSNHDVRADGLQELVGNMANFVGGMEHVNKQAQNAVSGLKQANLGRDSELPRLIDSFGGCIQALTKLSEDCEQKSPLFKQLLLSAQSRIQSPATPISSPGIGNDPGSAKKNSPPFTGAL